MERSFIELKNVKKIYEVGGQKYNALDGVDLNINQHVKKPYGLICCMQSYNIFLIYANLNMHIIIL